MVILEKIRNYSLGSIKRDAGYDADGLIALEAIPYGSLVVFDGENHCRLASAEDKTFYGIAIRSLKPTEACEGETNLDQYKVADVVDVLRKRAVIEVKIDEVLKVGEEVYYKNGKLSKTETGRPIGLIEAVVSETEKVYELFVY